MAEHPVSKKSSGKDAAVTQPLASARTGSTAGVSPTHDSAASDPHPELHPKITGDEGVLPEPAARFLSDRAINAVGAIVLLALIEGAVIFLLAKPGRDNNSVVKAPSEPEPTIEQIEKVFKSAEEKAAAIANGLDEDLPMPPMPKPPADDAGQKKSGSHMSPRASNPNADTGASTAATNQDASGSADASIAADTNNVASQSQPGQVGAETTASQPRKTANANSPTADNADAVRRTPIPDKQAYQRAAQDTVTKYAKQATDAVPFQDKIAAANFLVAKSHDPDVDDDRYFVLVKEAAGMFLDSGDTSAAFTQIDKLAERFDIDPLEEKLESLEHFDRSSLPAAARSDMARGALEVSRAATNAGRFDVAKQAATLASSLTGTADADTKLRAEVAEQLTDVRDFQEIAQRSRNSLDELSANPTNPEANRARGLHLWLTQADNRIVMSHLARSGVPHLTRPAQQEFPPPTQAREQGELADIWYRSAQVATGMEKRLCLSRAKYWYLQAAENLPPAQQSQIANRIAAIDRMLPAAAKQAAGQDRRESESRPSWYSGATPLPRLSIRSLELFGEQPTSKLATLGQYANLESLLTHNAAIGDEQITPLANLLNLRFLHLTGSPLTGKGLAKLERLTNLMQLHLDETPLSDADLTQLPALKSLRLLSLRKTQIKGPGLEHLKDFYRLGHLSIANTEVDDESVEFLLAIPNLQFVDVRNTRITAAGVSRLKSEMPGCIIEASGAQRGS